MMQVVAVFWNVNGFELWCEDGSVERWVQPAGGGPYRRMEVRCQ